MGREVIFKNELDLESGVPLYYQLMTLIKRYIISGVLNQGDLLPSESELCEWFNISRTTVRQAFASLEKEGLVERRRGKGTFVSVPKLRRSLNTLYSFSSEMNQLGLVADSEILSLEIVKPTPDLFKHFAFKPGEDSRVYKIVRRRSANGEPLMMETLFIPIKFCAGLTKEMLQNVSLYKTIGEKAGIKPVRAVETYDATTIDKTQAKLLNCAPGTCAFFVTRVSQ
ncbi:MAG: GntR family transcriptional regulator, partial [Eubacteriales bacterium]